MTFSIKFVLAFIFIMSLILLANVQADVKQNKAIQLNHQGVIMSLQQIIDKATAIQPGNILETDLDEEDGIYIYELEILDDNGLVWELEFNAQSGELLEIEQED